MPIVNQSSEPAWRRDKDGNGSEPRMITGWKVGQKEKTEFLHFFQMKKISRKI